MPVTAGQVKELRQATGVGMMECKKALDENDGNMEKAMLWLRERGMARAAKKAGRTAAEGVVTFAISSDHKQATIIELNCETDFASQNQEFASFAQQLAQLALQARCQSVDELTALELQGSPVSQQLTALISKVGENMTLRRVQSLGVTQGVVVGYSHMGGKIGSLVAIEGDDSQTAQDVGVELAMHVAAAAPRYLQRDEVAATELEQEQEIARKRLREQGKPEAIIEKALMGHVNKFYADICFVDQPFVKDPKVSVQAYAKQAGVRGTITGFVRFQLGEGIEVKRENFADEVAAQLGG